MRKLLALALFVAAIAGAVALAGAARTAVERHYDIVQAEQENTRLERRLSALRAQPLDEERGGDRFLPALVAAVAVLLAAAVLVGQGGFVALLANANRLVRTLRRPRGRNRAAPRAGPDRYIVRQPPALPGGQADEEEGTRWI